jgi:hypothetical protein
LGREVIFDSTKSCSGWQDTSGFQLGSDQAKEVARIQRDIREGKGKFATDEQMAALWESCGLSGGIEQQ